MSHPPLAQHFAYGDTVNHDVLRVLGPLQGRLLDVGSGAGAWAGLLRAAGAEELVALDPSPVAVGEARRRYDSAVLGTLEEASLIELGGRPFNVVVAADVLEHLVNPWEALRILRSWAAPGARLAVSVPNLRFYRLVGNLVFRGEFEYELHGVRDWTHLRWFTRRSLSRMLRDAGWEPRVWAASTTRKGRTLGRVSDVLANDLLRQQLILVATVRPAAPPTN